MTKLPLYSVYRKNAYMVLKTADLVMLNGRVADIKFHDILGEDDHTCITIGFPGALTTLSAAIWEGMNQEVEVVDNRMTLIDSEGDKFVLKLFNAVPMNIETDPLKA